MTPVALLILAGGGTVAALAVSSQQRQARNTAQARAAARVLEQAPATPPPAPRPRALPASTPASSIPAHVVEVVDKPAAAATAASAPLALDTQIRAPKVAATDLYAYVTGLIKGGKADELGSTAAPNSTIAAAQNDMRLVKVTGIYDTDTRTRGKVLIGREFPQRPKAGAAAAPAIPPTAAPAVVLERAPASAPPPPSAKVASHTPREAAEALLIYVSNPGADFGSKADPSDIVRDAQKAMGGLTADGIYGANTAKRISTLTGKAAPQRPSAATASAAAAPPSPSAAADAAEELIEYLEKPGANFGSKSKPSAEVRQGQTLMGGLKADGIYGTNTANRIKALTGKTPPTRS